jgi:hypothetical protein
MVNEVNVGKVIKVAGVASHDEASGKAGSPSTLGNLSLLAALRVDPFGEVGALAAAVDEFELSCGVERAEAVTSWAAQPSRERADRDPGACPWIVAVLRVPRGIA